MLIRDAELIRLAQWVSKVRIVDLQVELSPNIKQLSFQSTSLKELYLAMKIPSLYINCPNLKILCTKGHVNGAIINAPRLQSFRCKETPNLGAFELVSIRDTPLQPSALQDVRLLGINNTSMDVFVRYNLSQLKTLNLVVPVQDKSFTPVVMQTIFTKCKLLENVSIVAPNGMGSPQILDMPFLSSIHFSSKTLKNITIGYAPRLAKILLSNCDGFSGLLFKSKLPGLLLVNLHATMIQGAACINIINNCPNVTCMITTHCSKLTEPFKKLMSKANHEGNFAQVLEKGPSMLTSPKKKKKEIDPIDEKHLETSAFYEELN
jgi:hypothetical protein